jgi:hypothetical protein
LVTELTTACHIAMRIDFDKDVVTANVATTQIAPTILKVLGIAPDELEAVRLEHTKVLPGFE